MVSATKKKLREARFFLRQLLARDRVAPPDPVEFEFHLSAFLSAARSVTFALQSEEKEKYDAWLPRVEGLLSEEDRELYSQMKDQRNIAQKRGGVPVRVEWEFVPIIEAKRDEQGRRLYGLQWFGPVGAGQPKVGQPVHYFKLGDGEAEVAATCERYLGTLERLVDDFIETYGGSPRGSEDAR